MAGLGAIWFGRRLIQAPVGDWGFYTKSGLGFTFLATFSVFAYLGFWLWQVWRVRRK
jgi:hypothetical protein